MFGLNARADWTEESVVYDVDSKDSMAMGEALGFFPDAAGWLNNHNLTGASRLKVVEVKGKVAVYRWDNDANCTVADPGLIKKVELSSSYIHYLYEADPATVWELITDIQEPSPCMRPPVPAKKPRHRTRKI